MHEYWLTGERVDVWSHQLVRERGLPRICAAADEGSEGADAGCQPMPLLHASQISVQSTLT